MKNILTFVLRSFDCLFSCSRMGMLCLILFLSSCASTVNINGHQVKKHKNIDYQYVGWVLVGSFVGIAIVSQNITKQ